MPRIPRLDRTLTSTIPFARGVADRAFRTAGPVVSGVVGRVAAHLPRRPGPEPSSPESFAPSPSAPSAPGAADEATVEKSVEEGDVPAAEPATPKAPSPAMVARNVAGPRPTAKSPAKRKPRSVPGAKLPVTRPST